MLDLGMSSLGSFLQMVKCNWNFVSNRQKFSSHLVEVYHRSCRCIAMSNNTSSRVPRVVVWWRCWCLVRYGLLPCHSVNKWREKSSFFDILGETLLGDNNVFLGTQNILLFFFECPEFFFVALLCFHPFLVYGICLRNSPNIFWVSCIESLSLRSFRPSRPWEHPHVRARRSSFSPRRARKAERACRVVSGAYRAKRVAENESWKVVWGFKTSTFILVRFRVLCFL